MKPSKDLDEQIDEIVGTFISLKYDDDTEEYSDGTAERWGAMKHKLLALIEETKKAYGGCEKCYGKGYATVSSRWTAYDTDTDIGSPGGRYSGGEDFEMKFCDCERGAQLGKLVEQREREARTEENSMYIKEVTRHYFPSGPSEPHIPLVQFHERIAELKQELESYDHR